MNRLLKNHDYLLFIAMFYISIDLSSMVLAYKIIEIGPIIGAASSLIFPFTYSIMDVVAEVYGYNTAKKIILFSFVCDLTFSVLVLLISHIPSITPLQTMAYIQVLGSLFRSTIAQMVGVLSGAFLNIYLITKWKILLKGKYFWLRSIGSSTLGEAIMLIISVLIALTGILSLSQLSHLIIYAYIYKIIFAIVAAPFVSIAATILKMKMADSKENIDFIPSHKSSKQDFLANFPQ